MTSTSFAAVALRLAAALVLCATTMILWDVGSRSPLRLIRDTRTALRHVPSFAAGVVRFATGLAAAVTAGVLLGPLRSDRADFTTMMTVALLLGILIEQLVGADVRATFRRPPKVTT